MKSCALVAVVVFCFPMAASAQVVWTGDFETGDLSQFNFLLNPTVNNVDYTTLVQTVVNQGAYAARIELHDDALWTDGSRRVEIQHAPDAARTAEGRTTFFAWSFYVPTTIATDPPTQIGYWESNFSYQQMMGFTLRGEDLSFATRLPTTVVRWEGAGVVTPGEWHRIAMRVLWSKSAAVGSVSVWFDGDEVVSDLAVQTLNDDNLHFVQLGLLRSNLSFADVPVIYLDDAVEADTLADVRHDPSPPMMEPEPTDMGGSPTDMGGSPGDMGSPPADMGGPGPTDTGTNPPSDAGNDDGTPGSPDAGEDTAEGQSESLKKSGDKGCCTQVAGAPRSAGLVWLTLLGALAIRRRFSKA